MTASLSPTYRKWLWLTLLSILALRLFTLDAYPLQDTTEARYGEIARIMLETQNWVTPQFDYGVPFWGKPPLATWLSAGSYQLFGITEFAARLPSLLLAIAMLALVYYLGKRQHSTDLGLMAATILASSLMFFVAAGAVLMDTALVTGITLSMIAFWRIMNSGGRIWGYAFFIGISIGLLAKGPLALVLIGTPIGFWSLWQGKIRQLFKPIPWFSGGLLMLALTLPWYILAELRTPGFLDYFIIGEHWNRFTVSGWQGDLYGSAHARPRGTIWLYAIAALLPWALFIPLLIWRRVSGSRIFISQNHSWHIYLGLWAITPLLFFTFAGNILATYTLPSIIPMALLGGEIWMQACAANDTREGLCKTRLKLLPFAGMATPLLLVAAINLQNNGHIGTKSQKELLAAYHQQQAISEGRLIYLLKRPFSAQFYSRGKAIEAESWQQAMAYFEDDIRDYYVLKNRQLQNLPDKLRSKLQVTGQYHGYSLLREVATKETVQNAEKTGELL